MCASARKLPVACPMLGSRQLPVFAGPLHETTPLKITPKPLFWIAAVLLALVTSISFTFWSYQQIDGASNQRRHSRDIISLANGFISALKDAETGQRGYALTGEQAYLKPYLSVRDDFKGQLKMLREQTVLPDARQHLDVIVPLVDAKMAELSQAIELRRTGDLSAARLLMSSGEGRRLMDQIRNEMASYIGLQEQALVLADAEFDASMRRLLGIMVALAVFLLLSSYAVFCLKKKIKIKIKK